MSKGFDQRERASDMTTTGASDFACVYKQISSLLNIDKCVILRLWRFGPILWKTSPVCIE